MSAIFKVGSTDTSKEFHELHFPVLSKNYWYVLLPLGVWQLLQLSAIAPNFSEVLQSRKQIHVLSKTCLLLNCLFCGYFYCA